MTPEAEKLIRQQLADLEERVKRLERMPLPANHPAPAPTPWAKDMKGGAA